MSNISRQFIVAILEAGDVKSYLKFGKVAHLLKASDEKVHEFIDSHVRKYGKLPDLETVENHISDFDIPSVKENAAYYHDELVRADIQRTLVGAINKASKLMSGKEDKKDPEEALKLITQCVVDLSLRQEGAKIVDFRDAYDILWAMVVEKTTATFGEFGVHLGWPTFDKQSGGLQAGDLVSIVGRPATGKAQPLTSKVGTPNGFVDMGSLKIGDSVLSVDGKSNVIKAIHPQGKMKVYKIRFSDGREIRCTGDHLWSVYGSHFGKSGGQRVLTTKELDQKINTMRHENRISVPLINGDFGGGVLPMDPWLMGVFLGDGCLRGRSPMISTADDDIVVRVNNILHDGYIMTHRSKYDYGIIRPGFNKKMRDEDRENSYTKIFKELGLWGCKSQWKFIPDIYLRANRKDRMELLRGLMDTDGYVQGSSNVFCTTSDRLADGIQKLAWSMGLICSKTRKKNDYLGAWVLHLSTPNEEQLFWLNRKKVKTRRGPVRLYIKSIDEDGEEDCQCLSVSHLSKLYVTDGFVVTHNTYHLLYSALHTWNKQKTPVIFFSMEMSVELILQRLAAIQTSVAVDMFKFATFTTALEDKFLKGMAAVEKEDHFFYIIDGKMAANVDDVQMYCRHFQPGAIFIDGGYLLKHPDPRFNRYQRVAENCDSLKTEVCPIAPTIVSWQYSKEAAKKMKKKKERPDLEDIGYSDAISQLSSIVLGLFQEENVETLKKRQVDILKGREGEVGMFEVRWDFMHMDFSEYGLEGDITEEWYI